MWFWADATLAHQLTVQSKERGFFPREWGTMCSQNLLVHKTGNVVDGFLYGMPDSLYTYIAECWFQDPVLATGAGEGVRIFVTERGGYHQVTGIIDISRGRYINSLLARGAKYVKTCMQVGWEP